MSLPPPEDGNKVLVTGASTGTGRELARQLAMRGYRVAVAARRRDHLQQLADEVNAGSAGQIEVHACDLSDEAQRNQLIEEVRSDGRFVTGLCNDAGLGTFGKFQEREFEREHQQVRVNVVTVHHLTGAFLPEMVKRRSGAILNVGSLAGFQPLPGSTTYGATKAFVNSFSQGLNADLAGTGVSCTVLCPGPVASEFFNSANLPRWTWAGPRFLWATPAEMATASIEGMLKGRRMVYPRFTWGVAALGGRVMPRQVLLPTISRVIDSWVSHS